MSTFPVSIALGLGTLRSRPTLTMLAALLLAFGTGILAVLFGLLFLIENLQAHFASALTLEIELVHDAEAARVTVMSRAEAWPGVESVQYVPPDAILREIEQETGEDLTKLFGSNPFPPIVRVRFASVGLPALDSLAESARRWPDVADVVYPRAAWTNVDRFAARLKSGFGGTAIALAAVVLVLVGLCLRAQVRNRAATWEFLSLIGASPATIRHALLVQQVTVGVLGGLLATGLLELVMFFLRWLTLRSVGVPLWFHFCVLLSAVLLSVLAGLFSPRRFAVR